MGNAAVSLSQAAAWCGGRVAPEFEDTCFCGANFDTRRLQPGELFVAIKGARNGHEFVPAAIKAGAAAVLASEDLPWEVPAIYVKDTIKALQEIAAGYRGTLSCRCVGITGSVGKTTTKEMIAAVLETTFKTQKTAENYNNDIGVPVSVLSLDRDCQAAVLEMGMNHKGELSVLTRITKPDIAIITNVGTMHIENLGSREGILQAKLEILEGLRPGGTVIFCGDNDLLQREAEKYSAVLFGLGENNDVRADNIKEKDGKLSFRILTGGKEIPVTLPVTGEHNVLNALCAAAVGLQMGVPAENIQAGLQNFHNTGMRQNIYEKNGVTVIADCYNAGPESMKAALNVLGRQKGRRIAVLGGMLELGDYAEEAHFEVGTEAAMCADLLFAYGPCSEKYVEGARKFKMASAQNFETHEELAAALRKTIRKGDVLLFKGSHGMHMEKVLEMLQLQSEGDN